MNLSEKNLFARYYNWMYRELPNDLCSFFWGTVWAILLGIIMIPGRLCTDKYDSPGDKYGLGVVCWATLVLIILTGMIVWPKEYIKSLEWYFMLPLTFFTGILFWAVLIACFAGLGMYLEYRQQKKWKNYKYSSEPSTWDKTKDFIGAIRGKYCTKINWK